MKALVTAGPTYEPIDPVRFVGNRSSGKMGIAIAEELAAVGYEVTLVKGPTHLQAHNNAIREIEVQTAAEMFAACAQYFAASDVIVFAAAVADYTPEFASPTKIKKQKKAFSIKLVPTKDIAAELGKTKKEGQILVGFALETDNEMTHAGEKLIKKNFDFIVLNRVGDEGAGFQYDTNKITIIDKKGKVLDFDLKSKTDVAKDIVSYIGEFVKR